MSRPEPGTFWICESPFDVLAEALVLDVDETVRYLDIDHGCAEARLPLATFDGLFRPATRDEAVRIAARVRYAEHAAERTMREALYLRDRLWAALWLVDQCEASVK